MFKPDERPSTTSITALRERVKIARDKAQAAGMADVSVTLLECQGLLTFFQNVPSWTMFRGIVDCIIVANRKIIGPCVNARIRHLVTSKGRLTGRRLDVTFLDELVDIAKTIEVGDTISVDGSLFRGGRGIQLRVHHVEILKKGHLNDGNEVA